MFVPSVASAFCSDVHKKKNIANTPPPVDGCPGEGEMRVWQVMGFVPRASKVGRKEKERRPPPGGGIMG